MEPEPILQTLSMRQDFNLDGDSSPLQGTMNTLIQTNRFTPRENLRAYLREVGKEKNKQKKKRSIWRNLDKPTRRHEKNM